MSSPRQLLLHMPPEKAGDLTNPQSVFSTVTGGVATGPVDTLIDIGNSKCNKQMVTFLATQDVYICFGGPDVPAATSADWVLRAVDGPVTFLLDSRETRFYSVLQITAPGVLRHYVSG